MKKSESLVPQNIHQNLIQCNWELFYIGDERSLHDIHQLVMSPFCSNTGEHDGSLSCVAYEKDSDVLLIGKVDLVGTYVVVFPNGMQMRALLSNWKDIMAKNSEQLKVTSAASAAWSEVEKRTWWNSRQQADRELHSLLARIESSMGPWKCLLTSFQTTGKTSITYSHVGSRVKGVITDIESRIQDMRKSFGYAVSINPVVVECSTWLCLLIEAMNSNVNSTEDTAEGIRSVLSAVLTECMLGAVGKIGEFLDSAIEELFDANTRDVLEAKEADAGAFNLKSLSVQLNVCAFGDAGVSGEGVNYDDWKVSDLKIELKSRGLPTAGKKSDLLGRIHADDSSKPTAAVESKSGKLLLIYICNFHVLNHLLLIYICKLHWNHTAAVESKSARAPKKDKATSKKQPSDISQSFPLSTMSSLRTSTSSISIRHSVLILDETVQEIPWESVPSLRAMSCSRVPSLFYMLCALDTQSLSEKENSEKENNVPLTKSKNLIPACSVVSSKNPPLGTEQRPSVEILSYGPKSPYISVRKCWYAVDPEGYLPGTCHNLTQTLPRICHNLTQGMLSIPRAIYLGPGPL